MPNATYVIFIQFDPCNLPKTLVFLRIIWHVRLMFYSEGKLPCTIHKFITFLDIWTVKNVFLRVYVTGGIS